MNANLSTTSSRVFESPMPQAESELTKDSSCNDSVQKQSTPSTLADEYDLTAEEVRVLGVLIEKSFLTPDVFPLSLNALVNGCNQLTARDPVMELTSDSVSTALNRLVQYKFAAERQQAGGRVPKYEHHMNLRVSLEKPLLAILAVLLLRGAQTVGEIRARTERMYAFADIASVEDGLTQLCEKYPPMALRLPRAPGAKEARFVHLLSGTGGLSAFEDTQGMGVDTSSIVQKKPNFVDELQQEIHDLRVALGVLREEFEVFRAKF